MEKKMECGNEQGRAEKADGSFGVQAQRLAAKRTLDIWGEGQKDHRNPQKTYIHSLLCTWHQQSKDQEPTMQCHGVGGWDTMERTNICHKVQFWHLLEFIFK
jgi:hypothetical protein